MKKTIGLCLAGILVLASACRQKTEAGVSEQETAPVVDTLSGKCLTLYDKSLPEIKKYVDGKWELVSSESPHESCEYENTFIEFKGDDYVWTENNRPEPGALNWRLADTGAGYRSYLMDLFYADHPAYPLALEGDTLYIQDSTPTAYRYMLVRR